MNVLTATHHTLNFNSLPFDKFEELCFWLVDETGEYELVEHFGGGGDKNRDVVGYTSDQELDYFQCKRYDNLSYSILKDELDGILAHVGVNEIKRPRRIYFVLSSAVSPEAKDKAKDYAKKIGLPEPAFWEPVILDKKVKRDAEAKRNYFNIPDGKNVEKLPQLNTTGLIAYGTHEYTFQIINQGDEPAVDCRWSIKGFAWPGYSGGPTAFYLAPGQKMDLRIAMPGDFMKQSPIRELRLHFEYSDSKNNKYFSERELIPEKVNSGAFYKIGAETGDFFPAKPSIGFTVNSIELLPKISQLDSRFATFSFKGKEGHLKIGISRTVGSIWQFNQDEINGAFLELIDRKITRMIQKGEYEVELTVTSDLLLKDKVGFESYQKFRDEIK